MSKESKNKKSPEVKSVGVIGMGTMGTCLIRGLIDSEALPANQIYYTRKRGTESDTVPDIQFAPNNKELVKKSDLIVLAVKPQSIAEVLEEIAPVLKPHHAVVTIAAGVTIEQVHAQIPKEILIVRAMPNTPALVREGITAFCLAKKYSSDAIKERGIYLAQWLFTPIGQVVQVEENQMDAVTGLSGCGPAYVYVVLESLTDGGIKVGLSREISQQLACQTVLGSAKMLMETGKHPAALKDDVTTPAGCTIDGLMELEEGKLRVTLIKAVVQATLRARSLRLPD